MGFRLQRRISLGKFVRLNISKSGVGVSVGITGLRISRGPRGTHFSIGLPGTGLSYRKQLSSKRRKKESQPRARTSAQAASRAATLPELPEPGFLAPGHEKDLLRTLPQHLLQFPADKAVEFLVGSTEFYVGFYCY